jgi:phospholipase/carboxylesterase
MPLASPSEPGAMTSYMEMAARPLPALVAISLLAACASPSESPSAPSGPTEADQAGPSRLTARPGRGGGSCAPGEHWLALGNGQRALMRVTAGGGTRGKALVLALHGAGSGGSRGGLYALRGGWNEPGVVMVAPASLGGTWSFLRGPDQDLPFVDRALKRAFARCRIDPLRVAIGGFSDGATYALTLGVSNGDLFRGIIALSPGGVLGENAVGKPRVFVAHGTLDNVLPISRTSDQIVKQLRAFGYRVTYRKFRGGHEVRPAISREAVRWFLRG